MRNIQPGVGYPLYQTQTARLIEAHCQALAPQPSLMQRAGLATAQLALAVAPHAQRIWVACGPGNNGGDGLDAAVHLQQWGKQPVVTWLGQPDHTPLDAAQARQRAQAAGVAFGNPLEQPDLVIDALLGLGTVPREPTGELAQCLQHIAASAAAVVSVDLPTGLSADTGVASQLHVTAHHTLCLMTLKPGCFTAQGKDACGTVWLDDLGATNFMASTGFTATPDARLATQPSQPPRLHASHKGSFGDVAIVGGASGMTGAALLAARAALHSGAGRVFVALLDPTPLRIDAQQPELMYRPFAQLPLHATLVCGCGGGEAVHTLLTQVLAAPQAVVLDADALNAVAHQTDWQQQLVVRATHCWPTVLTPHPLEAARLLGCSTPEIQSNRLQAAKALQAMFRCTVVLKGSGTVIASPGHLPVINPTGNARLATGGTGDVLAGMLGARLAAGQHAFAAACDAVFLHGLAAAHWPQAEAFTASALSRYAKIY